MTDRLWDGNAREGFFQGDLLLPTNCGHIFYVGGNTMATRMSPSGTCSSV